MEDLARCTINKNWTIHQFTKIDYGEGIHRLQDENLHNGGSWKENKGTVTWKLKWQRNTEFNLEYEWEKEIDSIWNRYWKSEVNNKLVSSSLVIFWLIIAIPKWIINLMLLSRSDIQNHTDIVYDIGIEILTATRNYYTYFLHTSSMSVLQKLFFPVPISLFKYCHTLTPHHVFHIFGDHANSLCGPALFTSSVSL